MDKFTAQVQAQFDAIVAHQSDDRPEMTDPVEINGICGESVNVWAYAGWVVVECHDGDATAATHLLTVKARRYAAAILMACEDADRLMRNEQTGSNRNG